MIYYNRSREITSAMGVTGFGRLFLAEYKREREKTRWITIYIYIYAIISIDIVLINNKYVNLLYLILINLLIFFYRLEKRLVHNIFVLQITKTSQTSYNIFLL